MKTVVFGKIIEKRHEIDAKVKTVTKEKGESIIVYTAKPEKKVVEKITGYEEILRYKGKPRYNGSELWNCFSPYKKFMINEEETVCIEKEIFRADLNEVHLYTNKVCSETELYKDEVENVYETYIKDFNKQMILSNDKMRTYCDLHKLSYEETDAIKLFEMVYPGHDYEIVEGCINICDYIAKVPINGTSFKTLVATSEMIVDAIDKSNSKTDVS